MLSDFFSFVHRKMTSPGATWWPWRRRIWKRWRLSAAPVALCSLSGWPWRRRGHRNSWEIKLIKPSSIIVLVNCIPTYLEKLQICNEKLVKCLNSYQFYANVQEIHLRIRVQVMHLLLFLCYLLGWDLFGSVLKSALRELLWFGTIQINRI